MPSAIVAQPFCLKMVYDVRVETPNKLNPVRIASFSPQEDKDKTSTVFIVSLIITFVLVCKIFKSFEFKTRNH